MSTSLSAMPPATTSTTPASRAAASLPVATGADHLVSALQAEGVQFVFVHPGASDLSVFERLTRSTLDVVFMRHEQSAAHAADGYARASGEVGVCVITSGAGVTNAITGIETAHLDSIPMVVLVAESTTPLSDEGASDGSDRNAFHSDKCDTIGLTRSCVKHSLVLTNADLLEATLKKAFFLARTGRPGPVLVELAAAVLSKPRSRPFHYDGEVAIRAYRTTWPPAHGQLRTAVDAIRSAERPLIYYGGGVVLGEAHAQLRELAALTGAPVTGTLMGLGGFDATHPQSLGMLGMHGLYEANMAMQHCDVLIAIGARFDDRVIGDPVDFAKPRRRIVHIDIDPTSISKRVAVDIPIVGHCAQVLDALNALLREAGVVDRRPDAWWTQIDTWRGARCLAYPPSDGRIKPQRVIELLATLPGAEDFVVTSDVGQHQMWTAQYFPFRQPRRWVNSGGLGTMGFGLPAAIGAAMAHPGKTVVCISGDGSIQMSTKELMTCMQYRLPIKIICLNNRQLGMVRQQQDLYHGRRRSHSYMEALPDFVRLAEAYGHRGLRLESDAALEPGLREAFADPRQLVFIEVLVDSSENVYPTLPPGRALTDMILRAPIAAEDL